MTRRLVVLALVLLATAAPAAASERHPTLGELEHEVMCPTCKTLLELSHAPVAERMRAFIRRRIAAGETKSRIEAELVHEFGEGVLASPPKHGFGLLAWLVPLLAGTGACLAVLALARSWHERAAPTAVPEIDPPAAQELERALAAFDD